MNWTFPKEHVQWMYLRREKWLFFKEMDSDAIEMHWQQYVCDGNGNSTCVVDQGRYLIHVDSRTMEGLYWNNDTCRILRGTWLYQTTGKYQSLVPFEEDEAMLLEKAWTELLKSREETSQVKTAYKILDHLELRETLKVTPIIQMNASEFTEGDEVIKKLGKKVEAVHRGKIRAVHATEAQDEMHLRPTLGKPKHVVFVIHGIGEHYCRNSKYKFPDIIACADTARVISQAIVDEKFSNEMEKDFIEYIPVEWSGAIRGVEDRLEIVSLKSLQFVRDLMNEVLADVLFYSVKQQKIMQYVVDLINNAYSVFMEKNPDFDGTFHIMGHSLGSVICYDVLVHQSNFCDAVNKDQGIGASICKQGEDFGKLNLKFTSFFAFGSPIGLFEAVRGNRIGLKNNLPTCDRIFNVNHPTDPVAYRIEPLIDEAMKDRDAVRIPTFEGADHFHYLLRDFGLKIQSESMQVMENVNAAANSVAFQFSRVSNLLRNKAIRDSVSPKSKVPEVISEDSDDTKQPGETSQHHRIDYELQSSAMEHLNPLAAALWAHTSYWESKDFIYFVVSQILQQP